MKGTVMPENQNWIQIIIEVLLATVGGISAMIGGTVLYLRKKDDEMFRDHVKKNNEDFKELWEKKTDDRIVIMLMGKLDNYISTQNKEMEGIRTDIKELTRAILSKSNTIRHME